MKRFFTSLSVIVAAMVTFAGCTKEEVKTPVSETKTVQFVAESIETKTAFGTPDENTYPTLWTENDSQIKLLLNFNEEVTADLKVADDFKTAKFTAEVPATNSTDSYTFYAISPASAYLGKADGKYYSVTIPTSQKPLENSVDEAAQILYAVSEEFGEIPNTVTMKFKHFTAYGKLSFVNLELGEAKITSVAITSSVDFANRWNYFVDTDSFAENSGASTITLTTDKTENLWFACAPVGSMNGKTLTFTINTDKGTLSKTVTLGEKHNFEAGRIANMKIDMSGVNIAESEVYDLVTDASDLTVDSKIIIVAKDYDFALSTTQNSNNRAQAAVTKNENSIKDPGNDVQILTVGEGKTSGTLSFSTGNQYLYAPGGGNYLRLTSELSENASWTVIIENGLATIKADRTDKNWMRYNATSSMFSCYDNGQKDIVIYKLQGSGAAPLPKLEAPTVTAVLNDDKTGIIVSWNVVANATSYVISGIGDDVIVENGNSYLFNNLQIGTYSVSVTAKAENYWPATGTADPVTVPFINTGELKTYTLTIEPSSFNSKSYADNNNAKISEATADDGSIFPVNWVSNQIMLQSKAMQWQKDKGYIYNTTDLGTIISVDIASTAGTFTYYLGTSEQPEENGSGGYFKIKVGTATGKVTNVVVKFQI